MKTQILLIVLMAGAMICAAQSIERDVVSSSGDYFEGGGISLSWTLGEIATETYVSGDNILTQGFQQPDLLHTITVDLTAMLEGPYNTVTNLMDLTLNTGGYIPFMHPYNPSLPYYNNPAPVWLYSGMENVGGIPANVVDWVIVQLRDATSPTNATSATIIDTKAGFILDNGAIVDPDGSSLLTFQASFFNDLYAVIYHRNHLGILSNFPLILNGGVYEYDFSSGEAQVYGGTAGHKELETGRWGMVAADGDGNGFIQISDSQEAWLVDLGASGYLGGDFDMNSLGQISDQQELWLPNLGTGGQIPAKGVTTNTGYASQVPK